MFRFIQLCLVLCLGISFATYAQMSKEQQKIWKKKQKSMSVEEFKKKVEGYETLTNENQTLEKKLADAEKALHEQQQTLDSLRNALAASQTASQKAKNTTATNEDYTTGTVFRVQVGAFKNKDLMKFVDHKRFHAETDDDGTKKYTLAAFRDYWEADLFKKYLREMGVNDAWVVAYQDGKRTQIESVLSAQEVQSIQAGEDKNQID